MRKKRKLQDPEAGFVSEGAGRKRITPTDIQQREFRLSFRGYNERDVDKFLDELTEEVGALVEEMRRLSEGTAAPDAGSGTAAADAGREADLILARAREEADLILARAREEAPAAFSGASGTIPLSGAEAEAVAQFLSTEREFLQGLGSLVQSHVETVKEMARAVRQTRETVKERAAALVEEPVPAPAEREEPSLGAPQPEEVTVVEEPATSGVRSDQSPGGDSEQSLRELFWGED